MDNIHTPPNSLTFKLGHSISERLKTLANIKNAMTSAIMQQVNDDTVSSDNEEFRIYQTLYLEAKSLEYELSQI